MTPDLIVVDLGEVLRQFAPDSPTLQPTLQRIAATNSSQLLRAFLRRFTIRDIVEATFAMNYDHPQDGFIWEVIENLLPEGAVGIEDSYEACEAFNLIVEMVVVEVDRVVRERFTQHGLAHTYQDFNFHRWVDRQSGAAVFCHRDYDPKNEFENMRPAY